MTQKTILLVEDNADDETFILHSLRRLGVDAAVDVARNGVEALAYLEDVNKPEPAVVLLDLKMPKLGGLDVLKKLRDESTRRVPVVVFTSSSEQKDIEDSYKLGAASYVRKPIDFDTFCQVVNHLVQYWLDVNESPPKPGAAPAPVASKGAPPSPTGTNGKGHASGKAPKSAPSR